MEKFWAHFCAFLIVVIGIPSATFAIMQQFAHPITGEEDQRVGFRILLASTGTRIVYGLRYLKLRWTAFYILSFLFFLLGCALPTRIKGQIDEWINVRFFCMYLYAHCLSIVRTFYCDDLMKFCSWTSFSLTISLFSTCIGIIIENIRQIDHYYSVISFGASSGLLLTGPILDYLTDVFFQDYPFICQVLGLIRSCVLV